MHTGYALCNVKCELINQHNSSKISTTEYIDSRNNFLVLQITIVLVHFKIIVHKHR